MTELLAFSLFGFIVLNVIYVAAIMNYVMQCEMMIDILHSTYKSVEMLLLKNNNPELKKSIEVCSEQNFKANIIIMYSFCQQNIIKARRLLKVLNGTSATAAALIVFNLVINIGLGNY